MFSSRSFYNVIHLQFYYCYWIVRPSRNYLNWKTHLYLSVPIFQGFHENSTLIVKKGVTSAGETLNVLKPDDNATISSHVVPLTTGFYISLEGTSKSSSKLAIVYSAFSYKECFTDANFLCRNHRCISILLHCDGYDHCGDSSDEPVTCSRGNFEVISDEADLICLFSFS